MIADIAQHRDELRDLCRRFGVRRLEVFGSAARPADFDPARSDIDFLVEFAVEETDFRRFLDFKAALEALLNRRVDLVADRVDKHLGRFVPSDANHARAGEDRLGAGDAAPHVHARVARRPFIGKQLAPHDGVDAVAGDEHGAGALVLRGDIAAVRDALAGIVGGVAREDGCEGCSLGGVRVSVLACCSASVRAS